MDDKLLTVVVNAHREGDWAFRAVRSAAAALAHLLNARPDARVELFVVCDRADDETFRCVGEALDVAQTNLYRYDASFSRIQTNFGDLGMARNAGVSASAGHFVAFLDGDDVWGDEWLLRGVDALEQAARAKGDEMIVAHPELNANYGDASLWWTHPDQRSDDFDPATFWTTNCWSSAAMTTRALLGREPYLPRTEGLGFEDWEWNARTVAAGALHVSVPGAVMFIRKKLDGLNADSSRKHQLPAHSPYFEADPDSLPRWRDVALPKPPTKGASLAWAVAQWRRVHAIEPALWPDARHVQAMPRFEVRPSRVVPKLVALLTKKIDYAPTHVLLAPCIVKGGADLRVMNYARAIARAGGKPVVILTDRETDHEHLGTLAADGVHVVDAFDAFRIAEHDASVLALVRLLMRWHPVIHVINSRVGYSAVHTFGATLHDSRVGPIFCSLYGSERSSGRLGGAAFNGWFDAAKKHIDVVLSDNEAHLEELGDVYCWPRTRAAVVPSIVYVPDYALRPKRIDSVRVLWASRIVAGKRLDRLVAAAKLAHESKLPFFFAVAGAPADAAGADAVAALRALPNVKVAARAYASWKELAPDKHDVFMFTSEAEGMPNVLLEALARGLPAVSTSVGDVSLLPAESVHIVSDPDDPRQWLEALALAAKKGKHAIAYLQKHHTAEAHDAALEAAGYFAGLKKGTDGHATDEAAADGAKGMDGDLERKAP